MEKENNTNWLTEELYKLGKQQAKIVSSGNEFYMDLLHDVLTSFQTRINIGKLDPNGITKNLLFISLKNTWLNQYQKQSTRLKKMGSVLEHQDFLADLQYSDAVDRKMSSVDRVYNTLNPVERELFLLRFVNRSNKKLVCTKLKLQSHEFNKIEENIITKIQNEYNDGTTKEE